MVAVCCCSCSVAIGEAEAVGCGGRSARGNADIEDGEQVDDGAFEEGVVFVEIDLEHDLRVGDVCR